MANGDLLESVEKVEREGGENNCH